MNNSTFSNVRDEYCAALTCSGVENPPLLGAFVLVIALISLAICGLNFYLILADKLVDSIPIFYLILSQQLADMCNISYYVIVGVFLTTSYRFNRTNMHWGVLVGYFECFMYTCQLLHNIAVAFVRTVFTFLDRFKCCPLSIKPVIKGRKFIFGMITVTWAATLISTICMYVLIPAETFYDIDYGYLSFATPDLVHVSTYDLYWALLERGTVIISVTLYIAVFLYISTQRSKTAVTTANETEVRNKSKEVRQERNVLIICFSNAVVCGVNTATWRFIGYLFNFTDIVNSVTMAVLSLLLVKRLRNRWIGMLTKRNKSTKIIKLPQ